MSVPSLTRRTLLAATAGAGLVTPLTGNPVAAAADAAAVRPFTFKASENVLAELRQRIVATQWPDRQTVNDQSQDVPLATLQELARYWASGYDWRRCEAKLDVLPQFVTQIDGID